jgi:hypothetical protein
MSEASFSLPAASSAETGTAQSAAERLLAIVECEQLSVSYGYFLDFVDADALANLFEEKAVWKTSTQTYNGREAIRNFWAAQKARPYQTRHIVTNTRVVLSDADHASGTAYLTMYRYDPANPETIKLEPVSIGVFQDEYVRTSDGWRFHSRKLETVRATSK